MLSPGCKCKASCSLGPRMKEVWGLGLRVQVCMGKIMSQVLFALWTYGTQPGHRPASLGETWTNNCTLSRVSRTIQPTRVLALTDESNKEAFHLQVLTFSTPLTTVQFSGACSTLSAHFPGSTRLCGKPGLTRVACESGNTKSPSRPGRPEPAALGPVLSYLWSSAVCT